MTTAKEDDVRGALTPEREAKLSKAFHQAWNDVMPDQAKYGIWPRTRANMMFERLAVRLQEQFIDDAGVEFCFADETVKIIFDDKIVARCKKANGKGLGQNIATHAVLAFCEAEEDLFGFAGLQKIEIVYGINATGTGIRAIMVQARDGETKLWAYRIDEAGDSTGDLPIKLPTPPTPPPTDGSDLVQPRTTPVVKKETDEK